MKSLLISLLISVLSGMPAAYGFSKPFSAEAVQSAPGMQTTRMKLYMASNDSVRIEMMTPNGTIVQQFLPSSGMMRVIYPDRGEYIEQQSPAPLSMPGSVVTDPCEAMPDAHCQRIGEETIDGQPAVHWQIMRRGPGGQEMKIDQWLEKKRGITLRETLPGGGSINAKMSGIEKVNGRDAERWEVVMTTNDGNQQSGTRWYDKELGITIREEFPNGAVRELQNIVIQEPNAELFEVPAGFRELTMPAQQQRR
jgi:hypothetical protein